MLTLDSRRYPKVRVGTMTPQDQLLFYIAAGDQPTDPIRIMKGLFLFTQEVKAGNLPAQQHTFVFQPMSYGPCATAVYEELDDLAESGRIVALPVLGQSWSRYQVTEIGRQEARRIEEREPTEVTAFLRELRQWCDQHSFSSLLKSIYKGYPDFAVNSVFKF